MCTQCPGSSVSRQQSQGARDAENPIAPLALTLTLTLERETGTSHGGQCSAGCLSRGSRTVGEDHPWEGILWVPLLSV